MPAFLFIMIGERQPHDISRNLKHLEKRNVIVMQSEILGIDPMRQEVSTRNGKLNYDYLIVSLGLQTRPDLVPGFAEASQHPWEMESALRLRDSLTPFSGGGGVVGVPLGPYRCPPAPYEAQWMLDGYFRQRGMRERVEIEGLRTETGQTFANPSGTLTMEQHAVPVRPFRHGDRRLRADAAPPGAVIGGDAARFGIGDIQGVSDDGHPLLRIQRH